MLCGGAVDRCLIFRDFNVNFYGWSRTVDSKTGLVDSFVYFKSQ